MNELVSNCPAGAVVWPPGVDRWSILEIAAHLADAELLEPARIRRIISHTAKHLGQMRSAAMAYEASNNKPQDRLRV
ncbi:MAG TPA: hypothetical protein VFY40_08650 [Blastocatellia bacterium]|nr:hypothetical protein [Blastocatellia bacterium]